MSTLSTWDDVKRLAQELEVKIRLAGMEARDRWRILQPRLFELEKTLTASGQKAGEAIEKEVAAIGDALRRLKDDLQSPK
jgi:hypothetical protein